MPDDEDAHLICENCGSEMNAFGFPEGSAVDMSNVGAVCNHCGHMNRLHGRYSGKRVGRLRVVVEQMSIEELIAARDALQAAMRTPGITVD